MGGAACYMYNGSSKQFTRHVIYVIQYGNGVTFSIDNLCVSPDYG